MILFTSITIIVCNGLHKYMAHSMIASCSLLCMAIVRMDYYSRLLLFTSTDAVQATRIVRIRNCSSELANRT